jgi:hypothetical protein
MSVLLKKTNPACSNIELIDLNECVGDSLKKINDIFINFSNIQAELSQILINNLYFRTYFDGLSSKMLNTALLIDSINSIYKAPYTTVQVLSSEWNSKQFSCYYPFLIDIVTYNNNIQIYNSVFLAHINFKYPPEKFPYGQKIDIFVSLTYTNVFDFVFKGNYVEDCSPTAKSGKDTLSCSGCGSDNRNAGCNIKGRGCRNAYSYCKSTKTSQNYTYKCIGTVGTTYTYDSYRPIPFEQSWNGDLRINYLSTLNEDMFVARVIKLKVEKNNQGAWVLI